MPYNILQLPFFQYHIHWSTTHLARVTASVMPTAKCPWSKWYSFNFMNCVDYSFPACSIERDGSFIPSALLQCGAELHSNNKTCLPPRKHWHNVMDDIVDNMVGDVGNIHWCLCTVNFHTPFWPSHEGHYPQELSQATPCSYFKYNSYILLSLCSTNSPKIGTGESTSTNGINMFLICHVRKILMDQQFSHLHCQKWKLVTCQGIQCIGQAWPKHL